METLVYGALGISVLAFIFGICAFNEVISIRNEMKQKSKKK